MNWSKRVFDLFFAGLGLLFLWPFLAVVGGLIKLGDPGPAFFAQERVGLRGKTFRILKFRTMVVDAERSGGQLTVGRDPRITRVGQFLRKTKLDELPQLINVLKGEMSLVGPRPEVPRYVALYTLDQRKVLDLVPGITDPASIRYRHESEILAGADDPETAYIQKIMPEKIRLNLDYAHKATRFSDFMVVIRTLIPVSMLSHNGPSERINSLL